MNNTTASRLKQLLKENNLKQIDIVNKAQPYCIKYNVKIGRNDISQYLSGRNLPGQKKLYILAKIFNVNEAWLMGLDVKKYKNDNLDNQIINKYNKLKDIDKLYIDNYIDLKLKEYERNDK